MGLDVGSFDRRIVEVVEIVYADYFFAAFEELVYQVGADEAGAAGYQNHGGHGSGRESEVFTQITRIAQMGLVVRTPRGVQVRGPRSGSATVRSEPAES